MDTLRERENYIFWRDISLRSWILETESSDTMFVYYGGRADDETRDCLDFFWIPPPLAGPEHPDIRWINIPQIIEIDYGVVHLLYVFPCFYVVLGQHPV